LAGENSTTPALAIWSMTVSEVLDDSAPRIAVTPEASSAVTDWVAMFVGVAGVLLGDVDLDALLRRVDVGDGHVRGLDGGRAEGRERSGLRQDRAEVEGQGLARGVRPAGRAGAAAENERGGAEDGDTRERGAEGLRA
jgi:hypothetical protein